MAEPMIRKLEGQAGHFLQNPNLAVLFDAIEAQGGVARVVGGAVRNALMNEPVTDIDLAADLSPSDLLSAGTFADLKTVPTGIDHGTITFVIDGEGFEVTSLRADVRTDGRHAEVEFGTDWEVDAKRRDFTVNGIYADRDGTLTDYVGGLEDIHSRTIRFIGDAELRIREDYLRALRLFRFFAWYGPERVGRPDADALRACAKTKDQLHTLSVERVWKELRLLLAANDPSKSLLWMRTTGVLAAILPESEKWGMDAIPGLIADERKNHWEADPILRFSSIVPMRADAMEDVAKRLRMSNQDGKALIAMAELPAPNKAASEEELREQCYFGDIVAIKRRLKLAIAAADTRGDEAEARTFEYQLAQASAFAKPEFPVKGQDLMDAGWSAGPEIGSALEKLEKKWVSSDFSLAKPELMAQLPTPHISN